MQVREWHAMGLPHDAVSVDSAIVAMHGRCWPLCIDPQVQLGDPEYTYEAAGVCFQACSVT